MSSSIPLRAGPYRSLLVAIVIVLLFFADALCTVAAASGGRPATVPPIVPAPDEKPILAVPVWSLHSELDRCINDAGGVVRGNRGDGVRVAEPHTYLSPQSGYVVRADFRRDDSSPPVLGRIVCWQGGMLIVHGIAVPPLDSGKTTLAVPAHHP